MKKACITIRPGTIVGIKGQAYKVTNNWTLDQCLVFKQIDPPHLTKTLHYRMGQEIDVRWTPDTRI